MRNESDPPRGRQPGVTGWGGLLLMASLVVGLFAPGAEARWEEMDDAAMEQVAAEAGISIEFTTMGCLGAMESLRLTDTDTGNAIEFKDVRLHDGAGRPFTLRTAGEAITIDVLGPGDPANPAGEATTLSIQVPALGQMKTIDVGQVVFCGREIGRLHAGNIAMPESYLYLSGHGGLDGEFGLAAGIDHLTYTYNESAPTPGRLDFGGLHLAGDFTANPADDPADPGTWSPVGEFRIGDLSAGRPAGLDIVTPEGGGPSYLSFNLPARGSLRVENIAFGSNSFGPCAIDGIQVHRLTLRLPAD